MRIDARAEKAELKAVPVTGAKEVSGVIEEFRAKYGAGDLKKYYAKLDVAIVADLR